MRRVVVLLACAATLAACTAKKHDECAGLVAATKSAHASVTATNVNAPDASLKDEKRSTDSLAIATGGASETIRALGGTLTSASLQNAARDYANALEATSEAAHAIPPLTEKIGTLTRSIGGSQSASLWTTTLSAADALQQRCKDTSPPHACAYVVPRIAPLPSLANDPDALTKLAGALEGAPRDDQAFWVNLYNLQGTLRVVANALRAVTNETIERRAVTADLDAAKAKLDAALAREPIAESAVEAACTP
jgi:hypothetical protein